MKRRDAGYILFYAADTVFLFLSFIIMAWYKQSHLATYIDSHKNYFIILAAIWLIVSIINGKIPGKDAVNFKTYFIKILVANLISFGLTMIILFGYGELSLSRIMVFGTVVVATLFELGMGSAIFSFRKAQVSDILEEDRYTRKVIPSEFEQVTKLSSRRNIKKIPFLVDPGIIESIVNELDEKSALEIIDMIGSKLTDKIAVMSITNPFNIKTLPEKRYRYIINLHKINDIKKLDQFINAVNSKVEQGGYFCYCVETKDQRKRKVLDRFPVGINYLVYTFDFIFNRIFPKLKVTRPIYIFFSSGNNAVISRAEALGRVCRGGFMIINERFIGDYLFIETQKRTEPLPIRENMGSPVIALNRIGKNGKEIKVYKLRTMHPYSEYIQDYVYLQNDIQFGGKFKNDFRVTSWGAICRKIWLDEFPMFINVFKGELKLVGVRPLSGQYFSLYNIKVQERRIKYKPGLIPPFYRDMPKDLESIQASEMKYLDLFDRHPVWTDISYFFISIWNILFKHARSK